ncbi:lysophospholipid acyltransferase family protein [Hymenobacter cellulosivorans]|uniref:Lysophospholipid acyltransferase family protein n=1 Tax=Hymenobacter cellulosivorans TaxID=2932249 RepID=A0ABY4FAW6_9BACT|nr:GNAT family N-acyltransferase [Hymenobacter cellulosivorans]UOQ53638.1 lysophospholipid acyltransferase family protein [Hymenobacter cellulosivorans]
MDFLSSSVFPYPSFLGRRSQELLRPVLSYFSGARDLQQLYEQTAHLRGREFIGALLRRLNITVTYDAAELRQLATTSSFVAVGNHPCGLLDGLVLLYVLTEVRPDFKLVANEVLAPLLPQLGNHLILVNPERAAAGQNVPGVRQLLHYVHNEVPIGLFPAGEVASQLQPFRPALEAEWHPTAGRLLTAAHVPVIPVWLSGHNSRSFNLLGLLHPWLRTARLPAELLNKRGQTIRVRLGRPIAAAELVRLAAPERLAYVRARVFALATPAAARVAVPLAPPVASETASELIARDINALRASRCLVRSGNWEVYLASKAELPHVLRELGRLRELTFRREGEGTQQALDLDRYDDYYRHLFLYDRVAQRLVGAYRIGRGRAILRQHGRRGFYLHSLFRLKKELEPFLAESLELGRSFVRAEYQKQPQPLALLWKGIAEYLSRHPEYRYLIGPVSISNRFSSVSRAVMVNFLTEHYWRSDLAALVKPRKQFRYRPLDAQEMPATLQTGLSSVQDLHKLIATFEAGGTGIPVLLRHYLKRNARLLGFNLDPNFSNTLDGFIVLDARELPARTLDLLER